jgi:hypothetical protein
MERLLALEYGDSEPAGRFRPPHPRSGRVA